MVGLWWAVSRIARSNYADFALCQQLSIVSWLPFEPLLRSQDLDAWIGADWTRKRLAHGNMLSGASQN